MLIEILAASFFSGLLGAMGFGSGTILIIWLTTLMSCSQLEAQGINLVFFIPCAALSLFILSKKGLVCKAEALPIAAGGTAGIISGQLMLSQIPSEYLSKLFGGFIVILSLRQIFSLLKEKCRTG